MAWKFPGSDDSSRGEGGGMGLRNGKASALERLGWGIAAGFFGVGFWAAGKCWFVGRELEREWGAMGELHGLQEGITRMTFLLERQEGWWMLAVVCGWAALAAAVGAWVCRRKRRKAAGLGGLSFAGGPPAPPAFAGGSPAAPGFAGGPPAPPAAGEDDETTRPGDGGDGIRSRETRGE